MTRKHIIQGMRRNMDFTRISGETADLMPEWTDIKNQLKLDSEVNKDSKADENKACYQGDIPQLGGTAVPLLKYPNSHLWCAVAQKTTSFLPLTDTKLM